MKPKIKLPKGKKRPSSEEVRAKAKPPRAHPKRNDPYMNEVINLFDDSGTFLYRGTRKECLRHAAKTFEKRKGYPRNLRGHAL